MSNNIQYIQTTTVQCASTGYQERKRDVGGIELHQAYLNYTGRPVSVILRNGLRFSIQPCENVKTGQFIIRNEYTIPQSSYEDIQRLFIYLEDRPEDYPDLRILREAFIGVDHRRQRFSQFTVVVDTIADYATFAKLKTVYLPSRDLTLTTEPYKTEVTHPFGKLSLVKERYGELSKKNKGTSTFLELVDNEADVGIRYYFAAKRIFEVYPFKDSERSSGVYFTVIEHDSHGQQHITSVRFELSEGEEKLGLYKTREEALSAGDIKALRQEEITRLQHENVVQAATAQQLSQQHKLDLEALKLENAREEDERKRQILAMQESVQKAEAEVERLKREREQEKAIAELKVTQLKTEYETKKMRDSDHYEQLSLQRKNTTEYVKSFGVLLAAGLSIALIVAKNKKDS